MHSGFEMRGNFKEQPFIAYGALFGAPSRLDQLVPTRRDYTYAVSVDFAELSLKCVQP
jgi:hypothetical protein